MSDVQSDTCPRYSLTTSSMLSLSTNNKSFTYNSKLSPAGASKTQVVSTGRERDSAWVEFLKALPGGREGITTAQTRLAAELWTRLKKDLSSSFPLPRAAALDGTLQVVWDKGDHHFHVDFEPEGTVYWFYMNRRTDESAGNDEASLNPLPQGLWDKAQQLLT